MRESHAAKPAWIDGSSPAGVPKLGFLKIQSTRDSFLAAGEPEAGEFPRSTGLRKAVIEFANVSASVSLHPISNRPSRTPWSE